MYRSHTVENSLWKRLWTCHKTDYEIKIIEILQYTIKTKSKYKRQENLSASVVIHVY